ncbi:MAG: DMT family transporter [Proteobacteria bacterium]|nr:DMT family transporter [Pseudomonadota bacterium]
MTSFPFLAPLYALCSAFLFALSNHFVHIGLDGTDARSGTLVSIAASALSYWLISPLFLESWYWLTSACLLFGMVGIIRPALSSMLATSSIKVMGPTLTSALTSATPMFGAVFAILILGERLTIPVALGTAAVIAGAVVGAWSPTGVKRSWPLWALVLPLGTSLIRAAGHIGTKLGMAEVPSASFAVMVSNTVSFVLAVAVFKLQRRPFVATQRSIVWFAASGVANALSLQFLNSALQVGDVVAVTPIVSATPVFTLALGYLWFGREAITPRTVLTIALIVPGVMLVALAGKR